MTFQRCRGFSAGGGFWRLKTAEVSKHHWVNHGCCCFTTWQLTLVSFNVNYEDKPSKINKQIISRQKALFEKAGFLNRSGNEDQTNPGFYTCCVENYRTRHSSLTSAFRIIADFSAFHPWKVSDWGLGLSTRGKQRRQTLDIGTDERETRLTRQGWEEACGIQSEKTGCGEEG